MNPYETLGGNAFWSTAIAQKHPMDIDGLWSPKFGIAPSDAVVTYGSCFAQHIGRALKSRGYRWFDAEPAPEALSAEDAARFNFGVFSARTGNIYTVSLLQQWLEWAAGLSTPPTEVWEKAGRFHDPFRPRIEPDGFESVEEVHATRAMTIAAFRESVINARVFVYTLGLTESWFNTADGYEYPMCPGTVAGSFDPALHGFVNQPVSFVIDKLERAIALLRQLNPAIRILLTVSPVPLTATNSGDHVLVATMRSKSVLRAAAAELASLHDYVDYFPSYEIISSPPFKGAFFDPNQRGVNHFGIDQVMAQFFAGLGQSGAEARAPVGSQTEPASSAGPVGNRRNGAGKRGMGRNGPGHGGKGLARKVGDQADTAADLVCEEELLAAFQSKGD